MVMRNAVEASVAQEYALGYELMRATLRHELRSATTAELAERIGVSEAALTHFMDGGEPVRKLWNAGTRIARGQDPESEAVQVELEMVAVNLIADTFPKRDRPRVRGLLADAVRAVVAAEGR